MTLPEPDRDLERRLAAWNPATPPDHGQNRDRMLFAAGAASHRPRHRDWAWAAGLGTALLGLGWQTLQLKQARAERDGLQRALVAARPDRPEPPPAATLTVASPPPAPDSYLALSRDLLHVADATGVDPQPPPHPGPGPEDPTNRPLRVRDFDRLPPT